MGGLLVLSADPGEALGAATKQYVDTGLSAKQNSLGFTAVNKAGDTLTGNLGLAALTTLGLGTYTPAEEATLTAALSAGDIGKTWYSDGVVKYWNGTAAKRAGAYVLCSQKDGKQVLICVSEITDNPQLAEQIFSTFKWLK